MNDNILKNFETTIWELSRQLEKSIRREKQLVWVVKQLRRENYRLRRKNNAALRRRPLDKKKDGGV